MPNLGLIIKTAGSVLAASAAVLGALKENPQLADGATRALDKVRSAMDSQNPKLRLDAKLSAIEACASAVEVQFGKSEEAERWRAEAAALRVRGELAWAAHTGKQRRRRMKTLSAETAEVLDHINTRLTELTASPVVDPARPAELAE